MAKHLRISTDDVHEADRLPFWEEQWRGLGITPATLDGEPFKGAVHGTQLGSVNVCNLKVGRHRVDRTPQLIRRCDPGLVKVVFQIAGEMCIEQLGQRSVLKPGHWLIYDTSRPYRLFNTASTDQLAILIPREEVVSRPFASWCMLRAFETGGVSSFVYRCVEAALENLDEDAGSVDDALSASIADLIQIALAEKMGSRTLITSRETMKERIKLFIRRNLGDPDLSIERIAQAMKCTKRYLHTVFDGEETISEHIWSMRLERCRSDLLNPALANRSITEIAFSWGFSNSAHFSRVFKERYGTSPRDFRATQGKSAASKGPAAGARLFSLVSG